MTKKEYLEFHKRFCEEMKAITMAKNADYTGTGDDPFANFTRVEALAISTTEQGFLTRMLDKMCRLSSFVQRGTLQVKDETVEDTLKDLANYCALLAGYIRSKKEAALKAPVQVIIPTGTNISGDVSLKPGSVIYSNSRGTRLATDAELASARRANDWVAP